MSEAVGCRPKSGHDTGSIAAFTVLLAVSLAALLGLVAEGGEVLAAHSLAMSEAEQAARAGAAQVSSATLHSGQILDLGSSPVEIAEQVMALDGHPGTASVSGDTVTATVAPFRVATPLLGLVGFAFVTVSASASAMAVAD